MHPGYGHGHWKLFDESYKLVAVIEAQPEATLANATDPHDVSKFAGLLASLVPSSLTTSRHSSRSLLLTRQS